ncbi:hypothetical protein EVAR_56117_1 [Eumeta japonica]|uniref:Uncharacterized protein n=1 Tax=Eumeta variegata TaxID=151549 RepID=A0A4C1YH42_EUMVA|nr:hypothetical protein EVAR_56117_1 [Eumeta japonica]
MVSPDFTTAAPKNVLFCGVICLVIAEPDPKKYRANAKDQQANKPDLSLTNEEKEFLREVESKFGIKSDITTENPKTESNDETSPFPAVIAIEIVNDTNVDSKGKRTIDANLGYGYKTNNGYTYAYFGKPTQEKGKFMIYPYSQEDIPPPRPDQYQQSIAVSSTVAPHLQQLYVSPGKSVVSNVEIQPSQAFELVPVHEQPTYNYQQPRTEINTKYEKVVGQHVPPSLSTQYPITETSQHSFVDSPQSILYTTYNGGQISGLSGNFPSVSPQYFVDSSQLLHHPQFQSAGLTADHLRAHGQQLTQRVVPVLILRVPSSQIINPTSELYPNLPQNYPLSQHLNSVNLQKLVQQYFRNSGYPQNSQFLKFSAQPSPIPTPIPSYESQQYIAPVHSHPSYTYADYSGVQYSAARPVVANYHASSASYPTQYYYSQTKPQQLSLQPQYQYRQEHIQPSREYYTKTVSQYQPTQTLKQTQSHSGLEHQNTGHKSVTIYEPEPTQQITPEYDTTKTSKHEYLPPSTPAPVYGPAKETQQIQEQQVVYNQASEPLSVQADDFQYTGNEGNVQKETLAIYPNQVSYEPEQQYQIKYVYQQPQHYDTTEKSYQLSENYPGAHHTQATVLPLNYNNLRIQNGAQKIDYVTPSPHLAKHPYNVMVPQIVLKNDEKVSHVYSQSVPQYTSSVATKEGDNSLAYLPPTGSQQTLAYQANYQSYPKRMVETDKTANSRGELKSISDGKKSS